MKSCIGIGHKNNLKYPKIISHGSQKTWGKFTKIPKLGRIFGQLSQVPIEVVIDLSWDHLKSVIGIRQILCLKVATWSSRETELIWGKFLYRKFNPTKVQPSYIYALIYYQ